MQGHLRQPCSGRVEEYQRVSAAAADERRHAASAASNLASGAETFEGVGRLETSFAARLLAAPFERMRAAPNERRRFVDRLPS